MNDRDKIREQLSAYIDGELSAGSRRKIEQAVDSDPQIADELRKLQSMRQLLGNLPREHADEQFVSQLLARAEKQHLIGPSAESEIRPELPWVRWVASAAVLLIAAGIGVVITSVLNVRDFSEREGKKAPIHSVGQIARNRSEMSEKRIDATREESPEKPAGVPPQLAPVKLGRARLDRDRSSPDRGGGPAMSGPAATEREFARVMNDSPSLPTVQLDYAKDQSSTARSVADVITSDDQPREIKNAKVSILRTDEVISRIRQAPTAQPKPTIAVELNEPSPSADKPERMQRRFTGSTGLASEVGLERAETKALNVARKSTKDEQGPHGDLPDVGKVLTGARHEIVFTDDLPQVQRDIERILRENRVVRIGGDASMKTNAARIRHQQILRTTNYALLVPRTTNQVEYLTYVTAEQMRKVIFEVSEIRRQQTVSQEQAPSPPVGKGPVATTKPQSQSTDPATKRVPRRRPYIALVQTPSGELRLKEHSDRQTPVRSRVLRRPERYPSTSITASSGAVFRPLLITLNLRYGDGTMAVLKETNLRPSTREAVAPMTSREADEEAKK